MSYGGVIGKMEIYGFGPAPRPRPLASSSQGSAAAMADREREREKALSLRRDGIPIFKEVNEAVKFLPMSLLAQGLLLLANLTRKHS